MPFHGKFNHIKMCMKLTFQIKWTNGFIIPQLISACLPSLRTEVNYINYIIVKGVRCAACLHIRNTVQFNGVYYNTITMTSVLKHY